MYTTIKTNSTIEWPLVIDFIGKGFVISCIKYIAWPVLIFSLVWLFRKEISHALQHFVFRKLDKLKSLEAFGTKAEFDMALTMQNAKPVEEAKADTVTKKDYNSLAKKYNDMYQEMLCWYGIVLLNNFSKKNGFWNNDELSAVHDFIKQVEYLKNKLGSEYIQKQLLKNAKFFSMLIETPREQLGKLSAEEFKI
jgi:hypothetical protein